MHLGHHVDAESIVAKAAAQRRLPDAVQVADRVAHLGQLLLMLPGPRDGLGGGVASVDQPVACHERPANGDGCRHDDGGHIGDVIGLCGLVGAPVR